MSGLSRRALARSLLEFDGSACESIADACDAYAILMLAYVVRVEQASFRLIRLRVRHTPSSTINSWGMKFLAHHQEQSFWGTMTLAYDLGLNRDHFHAIMDTVYSVLQQHRR